MSIDLGHGAVAVVTRAVQVTCSAEARAAGLLVSTAKARRTSSLARFHDAIRFAEREHLTDYHPAFHTNPASSQDTDDHAGDDSAGRVAAAVSDTAGLFVSLGWEPALAEDAVAYVAWRLGDLSSRSRALEVLRRDRDVPARLGLPFRSWTALLRIVLGHPDPKHTGTPMGDGVLLRLLNGEPLHSLRGDPRLVAAIRAANPNKTAAP
jgi:hypothetical protein